MCFTPLEIVIYTLALIGALVVFFAILSITGLLEG